MADSGAVLSLLEEGQDRRRTVTFGSEHGGERNLPIHPHLASERCLLPGGLLRLQRTTIAFRC